MKITSIVKQKNNEKRYNIYIDNEFSFSCYSEDIIKNSFKEGYIIDNIEQLEQIKLTCEMTKAYEYALYLVGQRDYTRFELEKKLRNKFYSDTTISKVLEKLAYYSLIDDKRYADKYVKDCINFKKYGKRKILYNLQCKGINKDVLENISINNDIIIKNATELAQKKLKSLEGKKDTAGKLFRYLQSKGYDYEVIIRVIDELINVNLE